MQLKTHQHKLAVIKMVAYTWSTFDEAAQ